MQNLAQDHSTNNPAPRNLADLLNQAPALPAQVAPPPLTPSRSAHAREYPVEPLTRDQLEAHALALLQRQPPHPLGWPLALLLGATDPGGQPFAPQGRRNTTATAIAWMLAGDFPNLDPAEVAEHCSPGLRVAIDAGSNMTVAKFENMLETAKQKRQDPGNAVKVAVDSINRHLAAMAQDAIPAITPAPVLAGPSDTRTLAGVAMVLRAHPAWAGVLGHDAFACRTVALREPPVRDVDRPNAPTAGPWTDAHTARARAWLTAEFGDEPPIAAVNDAVEIVARANSFHPVQLYLSALSWDGKERLPTLLSRYFGATETPYARLIGRKFMISAVARAFDPGCQVDTMLILEGQQGTFKSTAARTLAGASWFADTPLDFGNKDAAQCLQGKWIYEFGELASFSRGEINQIKAFVSSRSDNLRPSYGKRNEDFPRQCVFIGTTNGEHYLTDTTGNRRYWPVACGVIDAAALGHDRDQLWAEAVARYRGGERWWLEGAEVALAENEQAARESDDPWQSLIENWLVGPLCPDEGFTIVDVLKTACGVPEGAQALAQASRVGKLLTKLGCKKTRRNSEKRKYFRPQGTPPHST